MRSFNLIFFLLSFSLLFLTTIWFNSLILTWLLLLRGSLFIDVAARLRWIKKFSSVFEFLCNRWYTDSIQWYISIIPQKQIFMFFIDLETRFSLLNFFITDSIVILYITRWRRYTCEFNCFWLSSFNFTTSVMILHGFSRKLINLSIYSNLRNYYSGQIIIQFVIIVNIMSEKNNWEINCSISFHVCYQTI